MPKDTIVYILSVPSKPDEKQYIGITSEKGGGRRMRDKYKSDAHKNCPHNASIQLFRHRVYVKAIDHFRSDTFDEANIEMQLERERHPGQYLDEMKSTDTYIRAFEKEMIKENHWSFSPRKKMPPKSTDTEVLPVGIKRKRPSVDKDGRQRRYKDDNGKPKSSPQEQYITNLKNWAKYPKKALANDLYDVDPEEEEIILQKIQDIYDIMKDMTVKSNEDIEYGIKHPNLEQMKKNLKDANKYMEDKLKELLQEAMVEL